MSSIYNRFYTVYECVSQTTDKRDCGNLINCPNFMDYTYEERLKAKAQSSCSCKIFHFHSSDVINTVYAIALFHHENARNYYSSLGGHEGEVKVLFHIKKGSSEESFKNELLIKIKVFTCKVLNGWEEVKPVSESEPTTYQKENSSSDIAMFFKSIVCLLFPTFSEDEKHCVTVEQVGNYLTLKGYKFHILQMFDSVHPNPPIRQVTAKDRIEQAAYYKQEVERLSSVSGLCLDAQKWRLNCLTKLMLLLKE